jgi:4'-phosphopantetheinyl transferase EntD
MVVKHKRLVWKLQQETLLANKQKKLAFFSKASFFKTLYFKVQVHQAFR